MVQTNRLEMVKDGMAQRLHESGEEWIKVEGSRLAGRQKAILGGD